MMPENDFVKLTNSVYKILDCLPDSDPLKNRAKEKALAILQSLTLQQTENLAGDIRLLENYLKIGKEQGWISALNFSILTKEYQLIETGFEKQMPSKPQILDKPNSPKEPEELPNITKPTSLLYSQRQYKILEILHKRERAQVSDLIKQLPKVTKRTVRRDLDELLKKGEIIRAGEWNQVFYQVKG